MKNKCTQFIILTHFWQNYTFSGNTEKYNIIEIIIKYKWSNYCNNYIIIIKSKQLL